MQFGPQGFAIHHKSHCKVVSKTILFLLKAGFHQRRSRSKSRNHGSKFENLVLVVQSKGPYIETNKTYSTCSKDKVFYSPKMLSDQVCCHCFWNVSDHYSLCGIIMALIIKQIGKMPQHDHHQHTVDDGKDCVHPENTRVWS